METLIRIGQLLLSLSILIALHEGGHFMAARVFKTRVEKFYLFFDFLFPFPHLLNFSLYKKKKGGTEFGIGWFPLGGYVKIAGMVDESMDKEQLAGPPQPWEFRSKPAWQRLIIMLGGIIMNLILAFVIYAFVLFAWGEKRLANDHLTSGIWCTDSIMIEMGLQNGDKILSVNDQAIEYYSDIVPKILMGGKLTVERKGEPLTLPIPEDLIEQLLDARQTPILLMPRMPFFVGGFSDDSPNKESGLKKKDRIISINGTPTRFFDEVHDILKQYANGQTEITVLRDEKEVILPVKVNGEGMIGVAPMNLSFDDMDRLGIYEFENRHYGFFEAFPAGFRYTVERFSGYMDQLALILNPSTGAYKGLGGFGTIGKMFPPTWEWELFWHTTAFISLILAFVNFLPIPMLDGGYVLFTLVEIVSRRKIPDKFLEYANMVGFVILILLILYANGNDIFRALK